MKPLACLAATACLAWAAAAFALTMDVTVTPESLAESNPGFRVEVRDAGSEFVTFTLRVDGKSGRLAGGRCGTYLNSGSAATTWETVRDTPTVVPPAARPIASPGRSRGAPGPKPTQSPTLIAVEWVHPIIQHDLSGRDSADVTIYEVTVNRAWLPQVGLRYTVVGGRDAADIYSFPLELFDIDHRKSDQKR